MNITNWDKWQTFRKDRGTPPWIKVYRNLLSNEQWVSLSDTEKGHLVSIWILAADKNGSIPDEPKMIQRMAMLDSKPNISKFIELGFLTSTCQPHDNHELDLCPQVDAPEKSRVETEKSRVDESLNTYQPPVDMSVKSKLDDIFNYWRLTMNKNGQTLLNKKRADAVKGRLKEGYKVEEIKKAILGCSMTAHNMGQNEGGNLFNDLELICRNGSQVERFASNSEQVKPQFSVTTQKTINNIIDVELD